MSSEGSPPPDDGSSPVNDQSANPPEKSSSSSSSPPPPAAEAEPKPTQPLPTDQPTQTPSAPGGGGATPVAPAAAAGTIPIVPGQPGETGIPALTPPPPPHRKRSSPARHKSGEPETDNGLLIAVVAGAVLLLLCIVALICCACCSKKKKKMRQYQFGSQKHMQYYATGGHNGGHYYTNNPPSHQKHWHSPEHTLHIPPPMGVPGGTWGPPFSPSPGFHGGGGQGHSADMSSNLSSPRSHAGLPPPLPSLGFNKNVFTYDELAAATSGFSQSSILGQGGFGYVYKGVLPGGTEIAVKSLKSGSGQGEREFQAEVEIISRVHHRHLVSLVSYCIAGGQRMLVYEFVPNNNLEFHLHGKGRPPIEWGNRMKIAMGSAKGLAYLHEDCHPRIIHRDIKTANILLDYSFEAKVADFGLAKLASDTFTHVSTRIMGTFGYLAPEYASSGKLTEKSDVYSFGIMMLELITGRRPIDMTGQMDECLVDWARPLLQRAMEDGNYEPFADPHLDNKYSPDDMKRMVACASASIRHSARRRPKMSQIVRALEGDVSLDNLNDGVKPGLSMAFGSSSDLDEAGAGTTYTAQMREFRRTALEADEYGTSEYGATSEYGHNASVSSEWSEGKNPKVDH